jgi:hypothetical protein
MGTKKKRRKPQQSVNFRGFNRTNGGTSLEGYLFALEALDVSAAARANIEQCTATRRPLFTKKTTESLGKVNKRKTENTQRQSVLLTLQEIRIDPSSKDSVIAD